jgi:hypothetical protein
MPVIQTTANKAVRTAHVYGDSLRRTTVTSRPASEPITGYTTSDRLASPVAINPLRPPRLQGSALAPTSLTPATLANPALFSPLMARTDTSANISQFNQLQQLLQMQQAQSFQTSLASNPTLPPSSTDLLNLLLLQSGSLSTASGGVSPGSSAGGSPLASSPAQTAAQTASVLQLLQALSGGVATTAAAAITTTH